MLSCRCVGAITGNCVKCSKLNFGEISFFFLFRQVLGAFNFVDSIRKYMASTLKCGLEKLITKETSSFPNSKRVNGKKCLDRQVVIKM